MQRLVTPHTVTCALIRMSGVGVETPHTPEHRPALLLTI